MKKTLTIISLSMFCIGNAQIQRIGINTDTPKETLDVEGTVRLKEPGEYVPGARPLGVSDQGRVIILEGENKDQAFASKKLRIPANRDGATVTKYDTGYNKTQYTLMVTSAHLVRNGSTEKPIMALQMVADGQGNRAMSNRLTTTYVWGRNRSKGVLTPGTKSGWVQGDLDGGDARKIAGLNPLLYTAPYVYATYDTGSNWFIKAGFDATHDILNNSQLYWEIEILAIKNSFSSFETINVTVGNDDRTLRRK